MGCHSPWVNLDLKTSMDLCSDDKLPLYMDIMQKLQTMSEEKMNEETGCIPKCHRRKFSVSQKSEQVNYVIPGRQVSFIKHLTDSKIYPNKCICPQVWFWLYFPGGNYEVTNEYYTYDGNSFIADVGGYLGLCLGFSLLSFFDMGVESVHWIMAKMRK